MIFKNYKNSSIYETIHVEGRFVKVYPSMYSAELSPIVEVVSVGRNARRKIADILITEFLAQEIFSLYIFIVVCTDEKIKTRARSIILQNGAIIKDNYVRGSQLGFMCFKPVRAEFLMFRALTPLF